MAITIVCVLILGVIVMSISLKVLRLMSEMHMLINFLHEDVTRRNGKIDSLSHAAILSNQTLVLVNKEINNMSISIKEFNSVLDNLDSIRDSKQTVIETSISAIDTIIEILKVEQEVNISVITNGLKTVSDSLKSTIPDPEDTGIDDNRE